MNLDDWVYGGSKPKFEFAEAGLVITRALREPRYSTGPHPSGGILVQREDSVTVPYHDLGCLAGVVQTELRRDLRLT